MHEKAKILFVDDEENILKSLRRAMMEENWDCQFALSPKEALGLLATEYFDVVVSDVMMPNMDGIALLSRIKQQYPSTVRIFLTGFAKKEKVTNALSEGYAQQIIPKPWIDQELKEIIRSALRQRAQQKKCSPKLQTLLNSMPLLPLLPESYTQVRNCISDEDTDLKKMAGLISQDVAISSTLLHWANSAMFGQRFQVDTIQKALVVLGTDIVVNLILSESVNRSIASNMPQIDSFDLNRFKRHSIATATISRLLLKALHPADSDLQDRAFIAGLLHDIGKLIAACYFSERFAAAIDLSRQKGCDLISAETEILGASHAELGSFLAEWWALPAFLVQAIRWHHAPQSTPVEPQIVSAVHAANLLSQQFDGEVTDGTARPDIPQEVRERFYLNEEGLDLLRMETEGILQALCRDH